MALQVFTVLIPLFYHDQHGLYGSQLLYYHDPFGLYGFYSSYAVMAIKVYAAYEF